MFELQIAANCNSASLEFFKIFQVGGAGGGGEQKHFTTGPMENSEFCVLSTSMFPMALPQGMLKVNRNKTNCFPGGQSLGKSLLFRI